MLERFTDKGRHVITVAHQEAMRHDHTGTDDLQLGTEHLLLGPIHDGEGAAAEALQALGISLDVVRQQVEEIIGPATVEPGGDIPTGGEEPPRARGFGITHGAGNALELSRREAMVVGHNWAGPEHILLGLIREGNGVAAQVLLSLGAELHRARQIVVHLAGPRPEPAVAAPPPVLAPPDTAARAGYTDRARRALARAEEEARMLGHSEIATEDLLLALVDEPDGLAATALEALGISAAEIGQAARDTASGQPPAGRIPWGTQATKTLEQAAQEALQLGHNYIGTEHLLLALTPLNIDHKGFAALVLGNRGADHARARHQVSQLLAQQDARSAGRDAAAEAIAPLRQELDRIWNALRTHGITPNDAAPDNR